MKTERTLDSIYYTKLREKLFEEAYELYPEYNDPGSDDCDSALYHILDGLDEEFDLTEEERDKLNDMVHGGLT